MGDLLGNRVYLGLVVWHPYTDEEEVRPGRHAPIILQELFDTVQQVKAQRVHWRGRRAVARTYPLSRRAVCFYCGASAAGDTGGKGNRRRMRHARGGTCGGWHSHNAERLEEQTGQVLSLRFELPRDWDRRIRKLVAKPTTSDGRDHNKEAQRLCSEQERLRDLYISGYMQKPEFSRKHETIQRQIADLAPDISEPIRLPDPERVAELLGNVGALFSHPGVTDARRKEFIEEVFESVQIDEIGIRAILPAEEYRPLMAVAMVGGNGAGDRGRTGDPLLGKCPMAVRLVLSGRPSSSAMNLLFAAGDVGVAGASGLRLQPSISPRSDHPARSARGPGGRACRPRSPRSAPASFGSASRRVA